MSSRKKTIAFLICRCLFASLCSLFCVLIFLLIQTSLKQFQDKIASQRTRRVWDDDAMTFVDVDQEDGDNDKQAQLVERKVEMQSQALASAIHQRDEAILLLRQKDQELTNLKRVSSEPLPDHDLSESSITGRSSRASRISTAINLGSEAKQIYLSLERQLEASSYQRLAIEQELIQSDKQRRQLEGMVRSQQEELVQQQIHMNSMQKHHEMALPLTAQECFHTLLASQSESRSYFYAAHSLKKCVESFLTHCSCNREAQAGALQTLKVWLELDFVLSFVSFACPGD